MTTPPLSPAAQAVFDAADGMEPRKYRGKALAAALVAAADQEKLGPAHWEGSEPDDYEKGWNAALCRISCIATELRQEVRP
jgi:hypothetical protein